MWSLIFHQVSLSFSKINFFLYFNMAKSNIPRAKPNLSSLLCSDRKDEEIIRLTRENTLLRDQLRNRQDHMDRMHDNIIVLAELLEVEQQRVQQLQKEVARLKKT